MSIQPYTHGQHAAKCAQAAQEGQVLAGQPVQIVRGGVVYCAQICGAWTTPTGLDCWTVETSTPEVCRMTVPVKQVRECGGAGCVCTPEAGRAHRAALAPHEGARPGLEGVTCL